MQPNNIPQPHIPVKGGAVPLDQPLPKELDNAALVEIAEVVGQTALEKSIKKDKALEIDQQNVQAVGDIVQTAGSIATDLAGAQLKGAAPAYRVRGTAGFTKDRAAEKVLQFKENLTGGKSVKELIKSPGKLSELEKNDPKKATSNPVVKTVIITGVALLVIGLITMFFIKVSVGIIIMIFGSIAVISSVFLPVGAKKE